MKDGFISEDLHSFPKLNELCLKSITGNKIDHTKLTAIRLKGKMAVSTLSEIMFLECGLGTRFVI